MSTEPTQIDRDADIFEKVVRDGGEAAWSALAASFLSRAHRAEGRCEGLMEGIAYLKARVEVLEAREREAAS